MKIVISGTSRGLGLALAEYLSQEHEVVGFARGAAEPANPRFLHLAGVDLCNEMSFELLGPHLEHADALINNVAVAHEGILATQGEDAIQEMVQVNLLAAIRLTKRFVRELLRRRQGGSIVTISSIVAMRGYRGLSVYAATKAGLDGFTRALARELGSKRITVNSVLPGFIITEMSQSLSQGQRDRILRRTPTGRFATGEDIAPLVDFLISEKARFITGQSIAVDGGLSV